MLYTVMDVSTHALGYVNIKDKEIAGTELDNTFSIAVHSFLIQEIQLARDVVVLVVR